MVYQEYVFTITGGEEYHRDLLIDALSNIGFDTFEETDPGFKAYVPSDRLDQNELIRTLQLFEADISLSYHVNIIPHENWNQVWETNFEPLEIGSCYIRATFHTPRPEFAYEIVIDPKMAFGTGHHETTSMMIGLMLDTNFKNKVVLDMGCGTGILAILAEKIGAKSVVAIDNDPGCFESTKDNSVLNKVNTIKVLCGSKEIIPVYKFDIILANINRNILLDQLSTYREVLKLGGEMFLSGFYEEPDLEIISSAATALNFDLVEAKNKRNWVAAKFKLTG